MGAQALLHKKEIGMMELKIRRLTPGTINDYLHFLCDVAFTNRPEWAGGTP